jgi:Pyridine nucleotide-disulphide oxidoreductase, dimerisation domain
MKVLLSRDDDLILGFTMIGAEAGEVMAAVQTAMVAKLPYQQLRDAILAHPTMAGGARLAFRKYSTAICVRRIASTASRNGVARPKEPSFTNLGHRSAAEEMGHLSLIRTWQAAAVGSRGPGLRQQPYRSLGPAPTGLEGSALLGASINEKILKHKAAFTAV